MAPASWSGMEGTKAEQIGDVISIAGETVAGETGKTVAGARGTEEEEREEKEEEEKEDDTPLILSIAGTERLSLAKRAI